MPPLLLQGDAPGGPATAIGERVLTVDAERSCMARWLASGMRRDLCVILHGTGGVRGRVAKSRLQDHYDDRVDPRQFHGTLDALVSNGHVEQRTEGVHDVYELTEPGRERLEAHFSWVRETAGV